MIDNRLAPKTLINYTNRSKAFVKWLKINCVECFDELNEMPNDTYDAHINLNLIPEEKLKEWLGYCSIHTQGAKVGQPKSKSTSEGFRAALIWFFKLKRVELPENFQDESNIFVTGVGKNNARLKEIGAMDPSEGKDALTFGGYRSLCQLAIKDEFFFRIHIFLTAVSTKII
jgi:hypothetical protein